VPDYFDAKGMFGSAWTSGPEQMDAESAYLNRWLRAFTPNCLKGKRLGLYGHSAVGEILCADYLGADTVVTPVSSNTAVEKVGAFEEVRRTRIGSPYVIEEMIRAVEAGRKRVVGYEANGGFLTASPFPIDQGGLLEPLPTRDPVVVHLGLLCLSRQKHVPLSRLVAELPRALHCERSSQGVSHPKEFGEDFQPAGRRHGCHGESLY
jgi:hypothetical protein